MTNPCENWVHYSNVWIFVHVHAGIRANTRVCLCVSSSARAVLQWFHVVMMTNSMLLKSYL